MKNLTLAFTFLLLTIAPFSAHSAFLDRNVETPKDYVSADPNVGDIEIIIVAGIFDKSYEFPGGEVIVCKYNPNTPCYVIIIGTVTDITVDPTGRNIEYHDISNYTESTDSDGNTTLTIYN